jgi:hypothetical protein
MLRISEGTPGKSIPYIEHEMTEKLDNEKVNFALQQRLGGYMAEIADFWP